MTADNAFVLAENFTAARRDIAMARAVESVAANAVLFGPLKRNAVVTVAIRDILMKSGLKRGDKRNFRKLLLEHAHRADIGRIMRRQNGVEFFHSREQIVGNRLNSRVTFGKHGFKSDSRDFVGAFEAAGLRIGQLAQAFAHGDAMVRRGNVLFLLKVANGNLTGARLVADAFDAAAR